MDREWPPGITPVTAQEAIQVIDQAEDDEEFADGMVGALEQGWFEAGIDQDGKLKFRLTDAGKEHVEGMGTEGEARRALAAALEPLDDAARERVIRWAAERFGVNPEG